MNYSLTKFISGQSSLKGLPWLFALYLSLSIFKKKKHLNFLPTELWFLFTSAGKDFSQKYALSLVEQTRFYQRGMCYQPGKSKEAIRPLSCVTPHPYLSFARGASTRNQLFVNL